MDQEAVQNFFNQIQNIWIKPELERRNESGKPFNSQIICCRILLPKDQPPIVEFNHEILWTGHVKLGHDVKKLKGESVYIHDIQELNNIESPKCNDKKVAFIYYALTNKGYKILFDFTPNLPEDLLDQNIRQKLNQTNLITESMREILLEKTVLEYKKMQKELQNVGLWAAPSLLPYPISKILFLIKNGNNTRAIDLLIKTCNSSFIESLIEKWSDNEIFSKRKLCIDQAFQAHQAGHYCLSIHAIMPQIEGIITDWMHSRSIDTENIPWRQESKTRKFFDLISTQPATTYVYTQVVESSVDFLINGPVLEEFKQWGEEINKTFPNRHVIGHGKYDERLYSKENSIKLFLFLDTIHEIINAKHLK